MTRFDRRALERVRHQPAARLHGCDLHAQAAIDDQLRWWHNRALHRAYGVAAGLGVRLAMDPATGVSTPSRVDVDPGVAYDAYGREIVSPFPMRLDVPSGAATLVVAYRAPVGVAAPVDAATGCAVDGLGGLGGRVSTATFVWVGPDAASSPDAVPLADARGGVLAPRRVYAHAMAQPIVASGATRPGFTAWRPWMHPRPGTKDGQPTTVDECLGVQTDIDTAGAAFEASPVPCYFAWIAERPGDGVGTTPLARRDWPGGFFTHVAPGATHRGFTFRVRMLGLPVIGGQLAIVSDTGEVQARTARFEVCWLGIQMSSGHSRHEPGR